MSTEDLLQRIQAEENKAATDTQGNFYIPEKYQLGILTDYLDTHGFDYTTEGRVFCYPIDLLCARRETTIAVEMKSAKVKRGIEQAWRNSDFVDFSYLAVWEERITDSLIKSVEDTPVGLFAVSEGVEQICTPQKTGEQLCSRDNVFTLIRDDVRNDSSLQQSE